MNKILMMSIDNLRYDCVGYQYDNRELVKNDVLKYLETPAIDAIAEKSRCFTQCISTNTYTTASHASIFTGLYPPRHGLRAFYQTKLHPDAITLAEILKENNYRTILYSDSPELFLPVGLSRGFEFVLTKSDENLFALLRDLHEEKVFLFCHLMDVHEPFLKCKYEYEKGVNDDYFSMVREMYSDNGLEVSGSGEWSFLLKRILNSRPADILFPLYVKGITKFDKGRLTYIMNSLGNLGFDGNAMKVIFSDHGEGRCLTNDANFFGHGGILYDNVIRIPFMIQHPKIPAGLDNRLVSSVDIFATVLSALNIDAPEDIDGLDIMRDDRDVCYSETWTTCMDLINIENIEQADFIKCQMALRGDSKKYVIWSKGGIEEFLDNRICSLSSDDYVEKLYRDILARKAGQEVRRQYSIALESGNATRQSLLYDFLNSVEYKSVPKFSLYDLAADPGENLPADASVLPDTYPFFNYIAEMDACAVKTGLIFGKEDDGDGLEISERNPGENDPDREAVMAQLKDLGYL
jgi:membrane-anchored protein YejM (alkaline phosphatase superfamily)